MTNKHNTGRDLLELLSSETFSSDKYQLVTVKFRLERRHFAGGRKRPSADDASPRVFTVTGQRAISCLQQLERRGLVYGPYVPPIYKRNGGA